MTAGQWPKFSDEAETLKVIGANDFEPQHLVYLPISAQTEVTGTNFSDAKISSPKWSAQRVQFSVQAVAPAMVVVAQSFYHNWHAFVDGRPVKLWRANHAFQALEVPGGQHAVTLI